MDEIGTVQIDDEIITNVNALWAASASGHLEIVKFLVGKGIDANCIVESENKSTPLRLV